ncbi:MAG: hypothetical protein P4L79_06010 [Legionella sp.]|uniref:hypothetical protein n=1 Tax=Legionella sp. TaxID=459 RepID=UPI002846E866|nr:hypothetical protein [Legionella sp.]
MFIDELASTYIVLEKIKPLLNKVSQKQKSALDQLNQNVAITDLVVRTPFAPYGEAVPSTNNPVQPAINRLQAYITTLFAFANEYHGAINCELESGNYQLKKDKKNNITRLSTHEFSFYTEQALTLTEFQLILSKIEKMAGKLTPNVHVLLSSFAVRSQDGTLLNMSVFIESGTPLSVHVFSKNTASKNDVNYDGVDSLFSQQQDEQVTFHADNISGESGFIISTGSVFEVKTQGGACYTQAIDICLDHGLQHSKEQLIRRILENDDEILPNQIEHCISSNSIELYNDSIISDYCVHIDPSTSMQAYGAPLGSKMLTNEAIKRIIPNEYPQTKIVEKKWGYQVVNPPFGSDCYIEVLNERPAAKYIPELQSAVEQHNQEVQAKQLAALKQEYLGSKGKVVQHIEQNNHLIHRMDELEKRMLKRCKPNVLQELLKTDEYKHKLEAKDVVSRCIKLMKDAINDKGNASLLLVRAWKKDFNGQIDAITPFGVQSSFKKALKKELREVIDNKLSKDLGCNFEPPRP